MDARLYVFSATPCEAPVHREAESKHDDGDRRSSKQVWFLEGLDSLNLLELQRMGEKAFEIGFAVVASAHQVHFCLHHQRILCADRTHSGRRYLVESGLYVGSAAYSSSHNDFYFSTRPQ